MTSEEPLNGAQNTEESKKTDDCAKFGDPTPKNNIKTDAEDEKKRKSHDLMRLVYELPEEEVKPPTNNNMLKENPPLTIVEITEQNGCETELDRVREECDVYFKVIDDSAGDGLGNMVVYDPLANNDIILEEYKEVIDRPSPDECSDDDLNEIKRILESKPKVLERYLRECATDEEVNRVHSVTSTGPLSPRPNYEARSTSVTSDLFQLWLASSPVKVSDNSYLFKATGDKCCVWSYHAMLAACQCHVLNSSRILRHLGDLSYYVYLFKMWKLC